MSPSDTNLQSEMPLYQAVMAGERSLDFGLLGEHLAHSHSPAIHAELGSTPYELVEVPSENAAAFIRSKRYRGLNVTIPYKKIAAAACDELSAVAKRLGNANTLVVRDDGSLYGDNTDYHGFSRQLASTGVDVAGRTCLVLGNGGAAATVRAVLANQGAARVLTATRHGGENLVPLEFVHSESPAANDVRASVSIIVNCTPVGMYPHADDMPLVDLARFPQLACVCDLVYNPLNTRLVQQARELGIPAAGGLTMLVAQAKRASDLFLGVERDDGKIEEALYRTMLHRLQSVSLIGMPGCGKSTIGKKLAKLMGYEFVDVDELVVQAAGMPIERIFAEQGEIAFREIETHCTAQALSMPGRVVATGGGVVTQPRNLPFLRQNGPVVLLARGLDVASEDELPTAGRPLSQAKGLARLREERACLYHAWADYEVPPASEGPWKTARTIASLLSCNAEPASTPLEGFQR